MKPLIAIILILPFGTAALAEEPRIDQARMQKGRTLTRIGIGLITAGAVVLPLTATNDNGTQGTSTHLWTGFSLLSGGGALMFWGAQEKRQATRPQTTVGVTLGRVKGVQLRRSW